MNEYGIARITGRYVKPIRFHANSWLEAIDKAKTEVVNFGEYQGHSFYLSDVPPAKRRMIFTV